MSYYQWVDNVTITLNNHEVYNSKYDLEESIKDDEEIVAKMRAKLFGMCCGSAKDLFNSTDDEGGRIDPIDAMTEEFNRLMDDIIEIEAHLVDKHYILENFDKQQQG
jgi:hypothetical protein